MNILDYDSKLQTIQSQLNKLESLQKNYFDTCVANKNHFDFTRMFAAGGAMWHKMWHPVKVPMFIVIAIGVVYLFPQLFYVTKYKEEGPIREICFKRMTLCFVILFIVLYCVKI